MINDCVSLNRNSRLASLLRAFLTRDVAQHVCAADTNKIPDQKTRRFSSTPGNMYLPLNKLGTPATAQKFSGMDFKIGALKSKYPKLFLNTSTGDRNVRQQG